MEKQLPKVVSVIMAAYNSERYIKNAVSSVLAQTYADLELLIVDDCSTDATYAILQEYAAKDSRVQLLRNEHNQGCAASRNRALTACRGAFVAFIDSDDVWQPQKLEHQLQFLQTQRADLVYTNYRMIDADGAFLKHRSVKKKACLEDLLDENYINFSSPLFTRQSLGALRFDSSWYHEDYVFLLQYMLQRPVCLCLDEELVSYRVHPGSRSYNKLNAAWHRWKIIRHYLKYSHVDSLHYFIRYAVNGLKKYKW